MDIVGCGTDVLVAAMQRGPVAGWDLRARADRASAVAWELQVLPIHGAVARLCCDPGNGHNWVVTGTARGQMCLWDLRFLLPVNSWRHPAGAAVNAMALATAPSSRLGLSQDASAARPLLFVAAGEREVALWDVGDGSCKEVLRVLRRGAPEAEHRQPPAALAAQPVVPRAVDVMGRAKQLGIAELQSPQPRKEGFRALLPRPSGQLLTGGTDRAIRCWDCERPQRSYMVAAPPSDDLLAGPHGQGSTPATMLRCTYAVRSVGGVPVVEETSSVERGSGNPDRLAARLAWGQHAAALCHEQSIVDVVQVQGAGEPLLVTAGLDGVVKAWR
jgi:phosphoinositide-3-kinase regulatory subunit 4